MKCIEDILSSDWSSVPETPIERIPPRIRAARCLWRNPVLQVENSASLCADGLSRGHDDALEDNWQLGDADERLSQLSGEVTGLSESPVAALTLFSERLLHVPSEEFHGLGKSINLVIVSAIRKCAKLRL